MATSASHGPGYAADAASPVHSFEQQLPTHTASPNHGGSSTLDFDSSLPVDHLPNPPPFVFPARPASPSSSSSASRRRRRPMSSVELHQRSASTSPVYGMATVPRPTALPDFSFNPGASLPPGPDSLAMLSPPITPNTSKPLASPQRPAGHGHRRGGSEFVGGSIRDGSSIAVMSTSPTKSESGFASPGLQPPRRGHRRGVSGNISTNDLPILHRQPDFLRPKGSSAPNSPTSFNPREAMLLPLDDQPPPLPEPANAIPYMTPFTSAVNTTLPSPLVSQMPDQSPKQRPVRARVGFSDTLEYIPRPLSLVSTDTSSTVTARPGHSVSGSISSIVSTASPGGRDSPAPLSRSPTREKVEPRPSTAGAILEGTAQFKNVNENNTSPRRRNSIPTLLDMAKAQGSTDEAASPVKTPKRWSFFGLDSFTSSGQPSKHRKLSSSSSESISKIVSAGSSSDPESDTSGDEAATASGKDRKKTSKTRRVRGWAGSILPRKPRSSKKRSKTHAVRPPTPPASIGPVEDDDEEKDDKPEPMDIELATPPTVTITESPPVDKPSNSQPRTQEDSAYPMIDLDAALGPFNTPLPHNPEWDAAQRAAGSTGKRRLHSAQGLKGFNGPGMHYHRRAESAPDLPPFDPGRSGLHRFGSSSTMADVFEEDEEDTIEARSEPTGTSSPSTSEDSNDSSDGEATPPAATGTMQPPATTLRARRSSSGASNSEAASSVHAVRMETSKTSLHEEVIAEESPSIIFRTTPILPTTTTDSVDSVSSSPMFLAGNREVSAVEMNQPLGGANGAMPISPYSTSHASSSYPSPRSPVSMDAQRISTAASSVTDGNSFHSLLMGEPGPEVRISVDYDIPSLTSSNSTMTRESFLPNPRTSQPSLREQRPVSVSSAAFGRRRSSLVSLSRLISSSHGERSKLSMEITLDDAEKRSRAKQSKTKRLGRMMQFWKPTTKEDGAT